VLHAARVTVRDALNNVPALRFGDGWLERRLADIAWLPRPLLLSLRTTFLRRTRLALTVGTLAAGGAVFMSALNVGGAWDRAVDRDFAVRRYDVSIRFARPQRVAAIAESVAAVPGLAVMQPGAPIPLFSRLPAAWGAEIAELRGVHVVHPEVWTRAHMIEGKASISPPRFLFGSDLEQAHKLNFSVYRGRAFGNI
jgi:hypothetical protein